MTTATAAANAYDLASWVKLRGPNFKADMRIAQLLNQCNEVVQDIVWAPGNQPMSHLNTQQTGLPPAYSRLLNQAVSPGRGQTAQIQESMGIAEAWQAVCRAWTAPTVNDFIDRVLADPRLLRHANECWDV